MAGTDGQIKALSVPRFRHQISGLDIESKYTQVRWIEVISGDRVEI